MNVRAWLYRIVTNACHDLGRQRARSATTNLSPEIAAAIPDHDATTDPERWLLRREAQSEVSGALGRMSNRSRTLLLLRERDELSCAEIGERLGASRAAVKSGCLLYTSDAADERSSVDFGGRRIIKKKKK